MDRLHTKLRTSSPKDHSLNHFSMLSCDRHKSINFQYLSNLNTNLHSTASYENKYTFLKFQSFIYLYLTQVCGFFKFVTKHDIHCIVLNILFFLSTCTVYYLQQKPNNYNILILLSTVSVCHTT